MKVKAITNSRPQILGYSISKGLEYELDSKDAKQLIQKGLVVEVKEQKKPKETKELKDKLETK